MDNQKSSILGLVGYAESYQRSANALQGEINSGKLNLPFDAPIYLLFTHAFELNLKALLIFHGLDNSSLKAISHGLLKLYDTVGQYDSVSAVIKEAETKNRDMWRAFLRNARDNHQQSLTRYLGFCNYSHEFGSYDNQTIGNEIPELRDVTKWLNLRHTFDGSKFRYFAGGVDSLPMVSAFNLKENIILRTITYTNDFLISKIRSIVLDP